MASRGTPAGKTLSRYVSDCIEKRFVLGRAK